jgi:hypothetical protein
MGATKRPKTNQSYEFLLSNQMGEIEELLARHRNEQLDLLARHKIQQEEAKQQLFSKRKTKSSKNSNDDEMDDKSKDQHESTTKEIKRRNPKAPGARAHRKTKEYAEGRDIIPEIKVFFSDKFIECEHGRVFCSSLLDTFKKYRIDNEKGELSALQEELFWRHGKKLFLEQFPKCKFTAYKHQRCYFGVHLK